MEEYQFENVEHALVWSFEQRRKSKFPQISSFYREIASEYTDEQRLWHGEYGKLPSDKDERVLLCSKVMRCLDELNTQEQAILYLKFLGDYHSEHALSAARVLQQRLREEGVRTRLSYRYSQRQIAGILKTNHRNVGRKLLLIYQKLEEIFIENGVLSAPVIPLNECKDRSLEL